MKPNRLGLRLTSALLPLAFSVWHAAPAWAAEASLHQTATIALGEVQGRIDHLAVDLDRRLLFVAELGNNSVSVIDLGNGTVQQRIANLPRPQGLAYVPATATLFVATGGDGLVRMYSVPDMSLKGTLVVGVDPDNVHLSPDGSRIAVGFLNGVSLIDAQTGALIATVPLSGHAEGFQFDASGSRIIVNVPDNSEIAVIDVASASVVGHWPNSGGGEANFPMAVAGTTVFSGFRAPTGMGIYSIETGMRLASAPLCRDSDDLFADVARGLLYAICGEGQIMTFAKQPDGDYVIAAQTPTLIGARTGLFVAELDQLFVAVPAQAGAAASIWVLAPTQ